jgi:hypothetical protein
MKWLKRIWHDPVGSNLIANAISNWLWTLITAVLATPVLYFAWRPLLGWGTAVIRVSRYQVIAWFLLGVSLPGVVCAVHRWRANEHGADKPLRMLGSTEQKVMRYLAEIPLRECRRCAGAG